MGHRQRPTVATRVIYAALAATCAMLTAPAGSAQSYDLEKAGQARSFFSQCAAAAEGAADTALPPAIATCKTAMNDISGLFSAYPDHSPMDLNVLAIYSGAAAYIVMALDMQQHQNRLSVDGCNHAYHVEKMYDSLTAETSEDVEALLRQNAETVKQHLIPWCDDVYGAE